MFVTAMEILDGDLHVMGGKDEVGVMFDRDIMVNMADRTLKESRRCHLYKRSNSLCVKVNMQEQLLNDKVMNSKNDEVIVLDTDDEEFDDDEFQFVLNMN